MSVLENHAIPKGSTVLVTGANGFIGSHVADQFLEHGYKVRGTVRNATKNAWLSEVFDKTYGKGVFELIEVPDMSAENAFTEAAKGVSAVVHTASIMTMDSDPNKVIPATIAGALSAMKAAYAEPSVRRFVLTSSSSAAADSSKPDAPGITVKKDTWNEQAVKDAWSENSDAQWGLQAVYPASKTQGEQAVWKFYEENRARRPDIIVNTVLPNLNLGKSLDPTNQGHPSSSIFPVILFGGKVLPQFQFLPPQYYVDVQDTGRLHVAAAIHPDVKSERIFAYAECTNWDSVLNVFRKNFPDKTFPENFQGGTDLNEIEERPRAEKLLQDLGRAGWTPYEESVLMNVEDIKDASPEVLEGLIQRVLAGLVAALA